MSRKIAYWGATGLVGVVTLLAGFSYVTSAPQAVENFRHVGYPQQLRVLLGIGKLAGAIVLLLPRLPTLKEWAYAGFTFMWIAASVAHYLAGDGALFLLPIALIGSLAVSYVTRPENRRGRRGDRSPSDLDRWSFLFDISAYPTDNSPRPAGSSALCEREGPRTGVMIAARRP